MTILIMALVFSAGMLVERWSWCHRIKDKASTGMRLECNGRLYTITED